MFRYDSFGHTAPPVSLKVLSHVSTTFYYCFSVSSSLIFTNLAALVIYMSSTKSTPTMSSVYCSRQNSVSSPKRFSLIIVNSMSLIITQILGQIRCLVRSLEGELSWEIYFTESPKYILISCVEDLNVFVIKNSASLLNTIHCKAKEAI